MSQETKEKKATWTSPTTTDGIVLLTWVSAIVTEADVEQPAVLLKERLPSDVTSWLPVTPSVLVTNGVLRSPWVLIGDDTLSAHDVVLLSTELKSVTVVGVTWSTPTVDSKVAIVSLSVADGHDVVEDGVEVTDTCLGLLMVFVRFKLQRSALSQQAVVPVQAWKWPTKF